MSLEVEDEEVLLHVLTVDGHGPLVLYCLSFCCIRKYVHKTIQ